ncbi:type II secretion system protein [Sulfuricurvum sp.]|uniref:type II secretion system protein n=1 Tax=Sulfuricurvum sp. TaxID=2025608 RepID=UPI003BB018A3
MKRSGFTMIELIFVIVILGILAAVAIPRLAATREDAQISKLATNISTLKTEIGSSIVATGTVDFSPGQATWENASNTAREMLAAGDASVNGDTLSFIDKANADAVCLTVQIDDTNTSNVQMVTVHGDGASALCDGVQNMVPEGNVTVSGRNVVY